MKAATFPTKDVKKRRKTEGQTMVESQKSELERWLKVSVEGEKNGCVDDDDEKKEKVWRDLSPIKSLDIL